MKIKNKKDFGLGVFCVVLAAWIAYMTMQLKPSLYEGDPGPRMFPMIGSVLIAVCGIALIIKQGEPGKAFLTAAQWKAAGKLFAVYILFVLLFWAFGFVIAVPVILFIITYMLSGLSAKDKTIKSRLIMSLIFAVLAGVVLYLAYVVGLDAKMPKGFLFQLLK